MHLFHIPQCTIQNRNVHISVLWDIEQVHYGTCELGQLDHYKWILVIFESKYDFHSRKYIWKRRLQMSTILFNVLIKNKKKWQHLPVNWNIASDYHIW